MILPIDDNYRLKADEHCWHIQKARSRTKDGKKVKTWESFKWYNDPDKAVNALGNLMVRTSDAQTLCQALGEIENVTTKLSQALTPNYKVIRVISNTP